MYMLHTDFNLALNANSIFFLYTIYYTNFLSLNLEKTWMWSNRPRHVASITYIYIYIHTHTQYTENFIYLDGLINK